MKGLRLSSFFLIFYTISLSIGLISSSTNLLTNQAALFVFGDSYFDVGNNNYFDTLHSARADFWPYGETTFKFPTGRFSDGRIIPDFIAEYAWLPLIPPYLQPGNNQFTYGVNFASGGAGALVETLQGLVIDLKKQLNNFKNVEKILRAKIGVAEAKEIFSRAVYLFHIGGNDYFYPFSKNSTILQSYTKSKHEFVNFVIGNITTVINEIYKVGGRKFGFMNLAPFDCTPAALLLDPTKVGSCFEPATGLIKLHNEAFPKVLKALESRLIGFKYAMHDFRTSALQRMNNPSKYGFKEGKKGCCGSGPFRGINTCGGRMGTSQDYDLCENPSDYVFFDSSHPSEKMHRQVAELMWSGPPNVTGPYNLKMLFEFRDK